MEKYLHQIIIEGKCVGFFVSNSTIGVCGDIEDRGYECIDSHGNNYKKINGMQLLTSSYIRSN